MQWQLYYLGQTREPSSHELPETKDAADAIKESDEQNAERKKKRRKKIKEKRVKRHAPAKELPRRGTALN